MKGGVTELDSVEWVIDHDNDVQLEVRWEGAIYLTKKDLEMMLESLEDNQ